MNAGESVSLKCSGINYHLLISGMSGNLQKRIAIMFPNEAKHPVLECKLFPDAPVNYKIKECFHNESSGKWGLTVQIRK